MNSHEVKSEVVATAITNAARKLAGEYQVREPSDQHTADLLNKVEAAPAGPRTVYVVLPTSVPRAIALVRGAQVLSMAIDYMDEPNLHEMGLIEIQSEYCARFTY